MIKSRVRYLTSDKIDFDKWDETLRQSSYQRVYALSWYLDIITDKSWSALVLGDYEAVFPFMVKSWFGIPYVTQPYLCQQLGIFDRKGQSLDDFCPFVFKYLKKNFLKCDILIGKHDERCLNVAPNTNHVLNLNKPYAELYQNYSRNTKRNIKKSEQLLYSIQESNDIEKFLQFVQTNDKSHVISVISNSIESLINTVLTKKIGKIIQIIHDEQILASSFYIEFGDRIYFLLCASNHLGIQYNMMYALIDDIIKNHALTPKILDFTGSKMQNIARRNEGFGAEKEIYYHLKTRWSFF